MKVGVFHPGTQHSWQTALAFQETQQLGWLATSVFYDGTRWPYKVERVLPSRWAAKVHKESERRSFPPLHPSNIRHIGLWEWAEIGAMRIGFRQLSHWCNTSGNTAFGRSVIKLFSREPVDVVWGYDSSSLEVFRWAKNNGTPCVLDQTIGHPAAQNEVMAREHERHSEFFLSHNAAFDSSWIAHNNEEIDLADLVVVGSEFCARTLKANGCSAEKIRVIPYGFDETLFPSQQPLRIPRNTRPVKFLFVGQLTPRKGAAYLLEAFRHISPRDASLVIVGRRDIPLRILERYASYVTHVPSVARTTVVNYFLEADCFVFPSLFEGGGIVLYEACGAGLGIIQSDRCGDGVQDGRNGIVQRTIEVSALVDAVTRLTSDRERLAHMQNASWQLKGSRTWAAYRYNIRQMLANEFSLLPPKSDT